MDVQVLVFYCGGESSVVGVYQDELIMKNAVKDILPIIASKANQLSGGDNFYLDEDSNTVVSIELNEAFAWFASETFKLDEVYFNEQELP